MPTVREVEAISEAIAETEKEIFGEAFGKEEIVEDESGDQSLEAMGEGLEGQHEPEESDEESESDEDEGEASGDEGEGEESGVTDEDRPRDAQGKFVKGEDADAGKKGKGGHGKDGQARGEQERDGGRVPSARLREANERARTAEAERDTLRQQAEARDRDWSQRFDQLTQRIEALQRPAPQQQQQPKAEEAAKQRPDPLLDPDGYTEWLNKGVQSQFADFGQQFSALRVEMSMQLAAGRHGETFTKANEAITRLNPRDPNDRATVQRLWNSPNPGEALVTWYRQQETLREVGNDPAAYKEKLSGEIRETLMKDPEFRKQLLADLQAEAQGQDTGRPRTTVRLPKSLNGTAGGNSARDVDPSQFDNSDQSVFDNAFS